MYQSESKSHTFAHYRAINTEHAGARSAFHVHPLAAVEQTGAGVVVAASVCRVQEEPVEHVLAHHHFLLREGC